MIDGIPTLDDLGDVRRQAGARAHRLQRADRGRTRSPTTSASVPRCPRSSGSPSAARRWCAPATSAGRRAAPDPKYSMEPVRERLAELAPGVELLENLRFDAGRGGQRAPRSSPAGRGHRRLRQRRLRCVAPRPRLDRRPAADAAVGDGSAARRRRSRSCSACATIPKRPFVAVLGGAKISDKLGVVEALLRCGRLARHRRGDVLHVLRRPGQARSATRCSSPIRSTRAGGSSTQRRSRSTCPRTSSASTPPATVRRRSARDLPDGAKGFDIGPGIGGRVQRRVMEARTVFWNGPMGMFEDDRFAAGTRTRRPGDGRHQGVHRRRRRRLGGGARPVPARRRRRPRVDRRRRSRSSCSSSATFPGSPRCEERRMPG